MAMSAGVSAAAGRRRHRRRPVMAEINVTPMVDVMLVLLIIFMVSAPLLTVGVPIDLPQTQAKTLDQDKEPLTVSVNVKGEVYLQDAEMPLDGTGRQAQGGDRGARRNGRAHLRARRPAGRLRHGDEGDGAAFIGGIPPRRAGDRGRAGFGTLTVGAMRTAYTISAVGHAAILLWSVLSFAAKPLPDPVRIPADRPRDG